MHGLLTFILPFSLFTKQIAAQPEMANDNTAVTELCFGNAQISD